MAGFIALNGQGVNDTAATTLTFTTTRDIQAGEYVCLAEACAGGGSTPTGVTVGSLTLTRDQFDTSVRTLSFWSKAATSLISSGATITVTYAGSVTNKWAHCFSLSGVDSAGLDVTNKRIIAAAGPGAVDSNSSGTPSVSNDIAIGFIRYDNSSLVLTDTWGTRILDQIDSAAFEKIETAYLVLSGNSATTATWSFASAWNAVECFVMLYKATAVALQQLRPDADTATTGWTTTPLWSKVDEVTAGGDVITATAA